MQVCVDEGELEGFCALGNDEGLAQVAEVGGVFAEDGMAIKDLAIAASGPAGAGVDREAFSKEIAAVVDGDERSGSEGSGGR